MLYCLECKVVSNFIILVFYVVIYTVVIYSNTVLEDTELRLTISTQWLAQYYIISGAQLRVVIFVVLEILE